MWAYKQTDLTAMQKWVLVVLADYCDQDDICFPAQSTVAQICRLSRTHVNKIVGELEQLGKINVLSRRRPNGSDTSCIYELNVPKVVPLRSKTDSVPGFIYVAESSSKRKIGITKDVPTRIRALETTFGEKIIVVRIFAMPMKDARTIEKKVKDAMKKFRLFGEWHSCSASALVEAIEALAPPVSVADTPPSATNTPPVSVADTHTNLLFNLPNEPKDKNSGLAPVDDWPVDFFEQFWKKYPPGRKTSKKEAKLKLEKIRKKGDHEGHPVTFGQIMTGLDRYIASKPDPQFTKAPEVWLNKECWAGEAPPTPGPGKGPGGGLTLFQIASGDFSGDQR